MSDITKTKTEIKTLEGRIAHLNAQFKAQHPNLCTKCGGVGGDITTSGDGWHEPMVEDWDDCEACLGQSLNPLDITSTISDEDAEAHAEMMLEGGHPILSKINELEVELHYEEMYQDHLAERELIEAQHERYIAEDY
jgi:hypothetical protein